MICRQSPERPSAVCRAIQSRPLAGFDSGYATLPGIAPPLNDASTVHGGETASTLTLLPKQRGRELTGCCQLLLLPPFYEARRHLGSRSPVASPCRNHASPQSPGHRMRCDQRPRIVQRAPKEVLADLSARHAATMPEVELPPEPEPEPGPAVPAVRRRSAPGR